MDDRGTGTGTEVPVRSMGLAAPDGVVTSRTTLDRTVLDLSDTIETLVPTQRAMWPLPARPVELSEQNEESFYREKDRHRADHTGSRAAWVAAPVAATPPDSDGTHKVIVCHATSSESNPYVRIEVDLASAGARGLKKVMGHHEHAVNSNKNGGTCVADASISAFEYDTERQWVHRRRRE